MPPEFCNPLTRRAKVNLYLNSVRRLVHPTVEWFAQQTLSCIFKSALPLLMSEA